MSSFFRTLKQGRLLSWIISALVFLIIIGLTSPAAGAGCNL